MASPSVPQHEPTMEEILASIRKIISEDSPEGQPAQPAPQAMVSSEPEVLELTQEVHEEPAPAPAPVVQPTVVKTAEEVAFHPIKEADVSSQAAVQPSASIFPDSARKAFDDVSGKFNPTEAAPVAPRDTQAPVAPHDTASLEALFDRAVRETFEPVLQQWLAEHSDAIVERMKPAIAEWMDKNFPPMLAAAVEAEFARTRKPR